MIVQYPTKSGVEDGWLPCSRGSPSAPVLSVLLTQRLVREYTLPPTWVSGISNHLVEVVIVSGETISVWDVLGAVKASEDQPYVRP